MATLKAVMALGVSAMIMGIGFRLGSDIYDSVKVAIILKKAGHLLNNEGYSNLKSQDPLRSGVHV